MRSRPQLGALLVAAVLAAASMWFYVDRILVGHQLADAAVHQRPRGNLSDLYPRWLGARELLLHRRNPYGDDITIEIQKGYYGRVLDPTRPNDPRDQQGFAYPVYVVFLLAPLIGLPFPALLVAFHWLLVGLTALNVWLWLRVLSWRLPPVAVATCIVFTLGSFSAVQGIKLQQLSLLVVALLAGAAACATRGSLFSSGALLALATIKPQLAWAMVAWLVFWAMSDWRTRKKLVLGFGLTMSALLMGSELVLPGWWRMFAHAIAQYHRYTQNHSVLQVLLDEAMGSANPGRAGRIGSEILEVLAILACAALLWRLRKESAETAEFGLGAALVLALTVIVVPMFAPYNQILLLPSILLLVRDREAFVSRSFAYKLLYWVGIGVVGWQWAASLWLTGIDLLVSQERALEFWTWPFFATFISPLWVFGLTILYVKTGPRPALRRPSEIR